MIMEYTNTATDIDIYTTLQEASEEIWKRWNDLKLRQDVESYLKEVPGFLRKEPRAVLWRQLASPSMEYLQFIKFANQIRLKPVMAEYLQDKFVGINREKLCLAKMPFYHGQNKNGEQLFNYRKVIDITIFEGKAISDVRTVWGESFVDFHHGLMARHTPIKIDMVDMSEWFSIHGGRAIGYYKYELALYLCNSVLFENFLTVGKEKQFTCDIVLPAIENLKKRFGVKPLIVPISDNPEDIYWWCYPAHIEAEVRRLLAGEGSTR